MKFQTLCVTLVLVLLTGGAWAEQPQRSPSGDLNAGVGGLEEKGQPLSEADVLQAALSDSSNSTACVRSGWQLYKSKQYQDALRDFQEAIYLNPTNATAYFYLGSCHYQLGEFAQAADSYRQYVILKPNPTGYYWLGNSLWKLDRFSDAEKEFRKAIDIDSTKAKYYDGLAYSLLELERYQEALGDFQKAISLNPTNAAAHFGLGSCRYNLGEYEPATDSFRQYVILTPCPEGHYWLANSLWNLDRFSDAEKEFRKASDLDSTKPAYYDGLGHCLLMLKRYPEAISAYKRAVALGGESARRCESLGYCYYRSDDLPQAQNWYRKWVSLDPHNSDAYLWLGNGFYRLKSYQQAESEYRHAVEFAPTNFYAHLYLGDTLFHLRRFPQAADAYQEAIRLEPENERALYWRGSSLMESLQFAEAIPDLEKAHQLKKEDKWARSDLFCAYAATFQFEKASGLYPIGYDFGVGALLTAFGFGTALLLKKSFKVSTTATPGLGLAIGWILMCFEGQLAFTFAAGLSGSTFVSGSIVIGMVAAPIPLLIAAMGAFPKQAWGAPFARPRSFPWKWVGVACLLLILILLGSAGYAKLVENIAHKPVPDPRNLPFIGEMIKGHLALAVFAGVILWPMAEEVLFRGLLFGALQKWLSTGWTILTTAIVFAAIHADLVYFLPLIAIGMLLGWVRNKTGSVWISAIIHILNNAVAFSALALPQ